MMAVFIPRAGGESHRPQMCHGRTQEDEYRPPLMSQGEAGSVSPPLTGSSTELRLTGTVGCGSPRRWAGGAQLCRPLLPKGCAQLTSAWTRGREALSPHRTRRGGEHSVAPLQQEGCVGFTAPGGCGSRSRTAAALRPARSSVVSHGPTAPRRDSCALTQRRRLPRIPPLTSFPPPSKPHRDPRGKTGGCAAVVRSGRNSGWVGAPPTRSAATPLCWWMWGEGGTGCPRGSSGDTSVPAGARGSHWGTQRWGCGMGSLWEPYGDSIPGRIAIEPHGHGQW